MTPLVAILGAGSARRFGSDKLSLDCGGKPLGSWALDAALNARYPVVWIAGETKPAFLGGQCEILTNRRAGEGIASSVACAAQAAMARGVDALLVMLADMPLVSTGLLQRLVGAGAPSACAHPGPKPGVPALFPAGSFAALTGLNGDSGAGPVLRDLPGLTIVPAEAWELLDVDTEGNLAEAARRLAEAPQLERSGLGRTGPLALSK